MAKRRDQLMKVDAGFHQQLKIQAAELGLPLIRLTRRLAEEDAVMEQFMKRMRQRRMGGF